MSVDSFIQPRASVDSSEHSSAPHAHLRTPLRSADPALDPRWNMSLTNAAERHAYLESIAGELPEIDRRVLTASAGTPPSGSHHPPSASRALSDTEDGHGGGGTRRTSMLRNRLMQGRNLGSLNRAPGGSQGGGSSAPTVPPLVGSGSGAYPLSNDARAGSSSSSVTTVPTTRRLAVSSAGTNPTASFPHAPSASYPQQIPLPTSPPPEPRRANAPGPITVSRQRTTSIAGAAMPSPGFQASHTSQPLQLLTTRDSNVQPINDPEYCLAFVGAKGCGKSTLIRKIIKNYNLADTSVIQVAGSTGLVKPATPHLGLFQSLTCLFRAVSYTDLRIDGPVPKTVRIFELDTALSTPEQPWPLPNQRLDGVMICYDVSEPSSFTRVMDVIAGFTGHNLSIIALACKSDLEMAVLPRDADLALRQFGVGLIEVTANTEDGKKKMRSAFSWAIKSIGRHRRGMLDLSDPSHLNPASPQALRGSQPFWDGLTTTSGSDTAVHSLTSGGRQSNGSMPAILPTDSHGTSAKQLSNGRSPTLPSTARTSFDSVMAESDTLRSATPPLRHSPSSPTNSPIRTRSANDMVADTPVRPGTGTGTATSTSATASPHPGASDGPLPRTASSSSAQQTPLQGRTGGTNDGTAVAPDVARNHDSTSLQWATLDEILDKLLFVSVSGDDPVFIQHFFLTYRRFASPRSVLLGMQKRMIQLSKETRDPLLAKFAQMRICNLLSQWKDNYPTDFGAPGTFGALSALLKQIVSNVHLVHYASDLLPFLEEVPNLTDREASWSKKEDTVGVDSDDEVADGTDEDAVLALEDDEETYLGKAKGAFEKRPPASSNPGPPPQTTQRPYPPKASSSAPDVATVSSQPSMPAQPRLPTGSSHLQQAPEKVITSTRITGKQPRVNPRELMNVANAIQNMETVHIAQEVTRRMLLLFRRIEARDWLRRTLSNKDYDKENDSIGQLGHLFNYLCCWVSAMIVVFDRPSARAKIMEKLVMVAKALRQLNNYMGMKAFVAGINSVRGNDDEELTQIMMAKPNSLWKGFQSLHVLLNSRAMGQTYRLALKHTVGPAIPDLERHGSDLFRTEERNLDYHPQNPNLIHWGKFTLMGKLVGTITLYQNRCFTMPDYRDLEERPTIGNLVFNQVVWDYDTLMIREARALEEARINESSGKRGWKLYFK
ncbi:SubName: Full=Uncharacterized protein {ECO:0000313/EMBL:CCA69114.1} [Serendipita indica DSM 11827]|nr:SubName: Full=Uncharacterized protein {ECO:0000313/EMBL:CCA69114.1} [Serendipita indica DSM 11827]